MTVASTEKLTALFSAAPVSIIVLDRTGKVLEWNPASERIFGWSAKEAVGKPAPFVSAERWPGLMQRLERVMMGDLIPAEEVTPTHKNGSVLRVALSAAPLRDATGEVQGIVGFVMDLTEQRALEEQLQQSQKLEAVGRLASGIAHDFSNVLTTVQGYAALLLEDLPAKDPRRSDLEEIMRAASHAADFTHQLHTFSRKQMIEPRLIDVNAVISDLEKMLGRMIGEDIALTVQLGPGPLSVVADRTHLEQILMNLALNARDAMPRGGTISIYTHALRVQPGQERAHGGAPPGGYITIDVGDTGTGIAPEVLEHMFEPFYTTKEPGKGTGLGLSTVYGIVKQNKGFINVASRVGSGTRFSIYLPEAAVQAPAPSPPSVAPLPSSASAAPSATPHHATILVVDDEATIRNLIRRILQRAHYHLLFAEDGVEALKLVEAHPTIDLLLTDVMLPRMDGPELVKRVAEMRPGLKVVYMSGHAAQDVGLAAASYLEKPFTPETLSRKIGEALGG
jgi:two-component system cell cycle sensor histidine kinase/response regulator CckA